MTKTKTEAPAHLCAVIAEYNPFHNGHAYHLQEARRASGCQVLAVIMSGNFVQRGELALVDKWDRTQAALASGADLVLELPAHLAVQAADYFALAGLRLAQSLKASHLAFGVESGQAEDFWAVAQAQPDPQRFNLSQRQAMSQRFDLAQTANNQLGIAYAKAALQLGMANSLTLVPIQRLGADHRQQELAPNTSFASDRVAINEATSVSEAPLPGALRDAIGPSDTSSPAAVSTTSDTSSPAAVNAISNASSPAFASGTALRKGLLEGQDLQDFVPHAMAQVLTPDLAQRYSRAQEAFFRLLTYQLTLLSVEQLRDFYEVKEGIEYVLKREIHKAQNLDDFLEACTNKRWSKARLRRVCTDIVLQVTKAEMQDDWAEPQPLLRLLGANDHGMAYLKTSDVPYVTQFKQKDMTHFQKQVDRDRLYQDLMGAAEQNFRRMIRVHETESYYQ